jgi:ribosome-associated protein
MLESMTASRNSRPPARAALVKTVAAALDDMKAVNVKVLDVRDVTDVSDCMVLASGNSDRHVRSIADRVVERAKAAGFRPMGVEGQRDGEWVLVDLNDVIVHVMLPRVREFYGLEGLWEVTPAKVSRGAGKPVASSRAKSAKGKAGTRAAPRPGRAAPKKKSGAPRATRAAPAARRSSRGKAGPRTGR